jgi:hypothetical protein
VSWETRPSGATTAPGSCKRQWGGKGNCHPQITSLESRSLTICGCCLADLWLPRKSASLRSTWRCDSGIGANGYWTPWVSHVWTRHHKGWYWRSGCRSSMDLNSEPNSSGVCRCWAKATLRSRLYLFKQAQLCVAASCDHVKWNSGCWRRGEGCAQMWETRSA